jgi:hypothetical protein
MLRPGDSNLEAVNIDGVIYWKVSGLNGTGIFGINYEFDISDVMTKLTVDSYSDHNITFGTVSDIKLGEKIVISLYGFDLTGIDYTDISFIDQFGAKNIGPTPDIDVWGVSVGGSKITLTAPSVSGFIDGGSMITLKIGQNVTSLANQIKNPDTVGEYMVIIEIEHLTESEYGQLGVAIIDNDIIDVTGFIDEYLYFDIDTGTDNNDCAYNQCEIYEMEGPGMNYTVDLGELSSTIVNRSGMSVKHSTSEEISRKINYIYFDLTTNAISGAIVTVKSMNSGLKGPGDGLIPSVSTGDSIDANSGRYGLTFSEVGETKSGTLNFNEQCNNGSNYCGPTTEPLWIINTGSHPVESGRAEMILAAAAAYTNNPGVYTDTLTFIATATF